MSKFFKTHYLFRYCSNRKRIGGGMISFVRDWLASLFSSIGGRKKSFKMGIYGPPNAGKTTLANKLCQDWLGQDMGSVSGIPHETRQVQIKEQISVKSKDGRDLLFNLVDTPGIATRIDFEDFIKAGMSEGKAKKRAKEATRGVIDAIKWLDDMDMVLVVLDATADPYSQVNITIIGNLAARNIPVLIIANKVDLRKANFKKIQAAFPQYEVVGISAKYGKNMEPFYDALFRLAGR